MRITAGMFRGRKLAVPDLPGLRPTPAKVRQALFNMLGDIEGWSMLDLFSGSGVMALEALSRGAAQVVSVESQPRALASLCRLRDSLELEDRWRVLRADVIRGLARLEGSDFDLVYADPPYARGWSERIPQLLMQHRVFCRQLVIEESARLAPSWPTGWVFHKTRRYGDTMLHFLSPEMQ